MPQRSLIENARGAWRPIAVGIALLLVTRLTLLLSLADVFFHGEALAKGASARALASATDLPRSMLPYVQYEGGGFVFSHLEALGFALLGPSLLALSLVALLWLLLSASLAILMVHAAFGRAAAWCFAALFALAPGAFQRMSLLGLGIHFEALLFVALVLLLAVRAANREANPRATWLALGAAIGFGAYFSYATLPISLTALVWVVASMPRGQRLRGIAALAVGIALGAAPLIGMMIAVGADVFDVHGQELLPAQTLSGPFAVLSDLLSSLWRGSSALTLVALLGAACVCLASCRALLHSTSRRHVLLVGACATVFALAYLFSGFDEPSLNHGFHLKRLSPLWLLLTVATCAAIADAARSPRLAKRGLAGAAFVLLAALGVRDWVGAVDQGARGFALDGGALLAHTRGHAWTAYVRAVAQRIPGDDLERARKLLELAPDEVESLAPAIASALWNETPEDEVLRVCRSFDATTKFHLLRGTGTWWRLVHGPAIAERAEQTERFEADERRALLLAIGRDMPGAVITPERIAAEIERWRERKLPPEVLEGLGERIVDAWTIPPQEGAFLESARVAWLLDPTRAEAFLASLDDAAEATILRRGYQAELARRRLAP